MCRTAASIIIASATCAAAAAAVQPLLNQTVTPTPPCSESSDATSSLVTRAPRLIRRRVGRRLQAVSDRCRCSTSRILGARPCRYTSEYSRASREWASEQARRKQVQVHPSRQHACCLLLAARCHPGTSFCLAPTSNLTRPHCHHSYLPYLPYLPLPPANPIVGKLPTAVMKPKSSPQNTKL